MARVWHYDGTTATRHEAEMESVEGGFRLSSEPGTTYAWSELAHGGEKGGQPVYKHATRAGWRLGFFAPPPSAIAQRLPRPTRYGAIIDRVGFWPTAAAFSILSAVVIAGVLKAPQVIAPLIPATFEQKLGDAMVGDMGGRICDGRGGQEALDKMVRRIEPNGAGLKVRVVNIGMVNAVALPGGNIFVFRGLLDKAASPDELAGVVGHEIGHVRNRDVMQALLRQTGLSLVLGGVGGNTGGYVNALVSSTYSREAETDADKYSIRAMQAGKISPKDTAGFFTRLAEQEKKLGRGAAALGYLSSHPLSESREKAFLGSKRTDIAYTPSLGEYEWITLQNICSNDPDVEKDDGLFF